MVFHLRRDCLLTLVCVLFLLSQTTQAERRYQNDAITSEVSQKMDFRNPEFVGPIPYIGPRIEINVAARELFLYQDDGEAWTLVKTYPIAVGSPIYRTPIGERRMDEITWNPAWYPPKSKWAEEAEITPPGPYNPLGRVKMNLGKSILIHGTNKPWSIGRAASHGCMRMKNEDALDLARYIQVAMTAEGTEENFNKYERRMYRSFKVKLDQEVPVNIVYETVALKEDKLYIYKDIYRKAGNTLENVISLLEMHGYDLADYDLDAIQKIVAKSKKDVELSLYEFSKENSEQLAQDHNFGIQATS